jgi:hypothetical protein
MPAKRKQHLEQIKVRFEPAQNLRIGHQLGQPISIESMFFDERHGVFGKELAHLAEPTRNGKLRGIKSAGAVLFFAYSATLVFS